ncbi:MAG TPA: HAD-IA family hydrolase [Solirubrobacterales bacterium]|nr:HAD-IA family hydrolase [Solirubrobacterales bacterium]
MSEADQQRTAGADIWAPAAILADLDGTLVDSVASSKRAWGALARRRGLDEEETHRFAMGRPTRETVALLVPEGERDAEQARIDRDEVEDAGSVTAYPGAAELLAGPIPVAVVTSGSTELATARLRGAGLEPPAVLVTADRIERGKPDPEPFLLGARELGVDPARCLALEDAPPGIESALAAGMPVVAFRTSHPDAELERATVVLDTLAEAVARLLPR